MNYFGFNTVVLTAKGYKEVMQVEVGDQIISDDKTFITVERIYKKAFSKDQYVVLTSRGGFSTLLHRDVSIGVYKDETSQTIFKPIYSLIPGDFLIMPALNMFNNNAQDILTDESADVLGSYLASCYAIDSKSGIVGRKSEIRFRAKNGLYRNFDANDVGRTGEYYTANKDNINLITEFFGEYGVMGTDKILSLSKHDSDKFITALIDCLHKTLKTYTDYFYSKSILLALQLLIYKVKGILITISRTGYSQQEVLNGGYLSLIEMLNEHLSTVANTNVMVHKTTSHPNRIFEIHLGQPAKTLNNKVSKYRLYNNTLYVAFDKLLPQSNELPLDFYGFKFNNVKPIYIDNILTMP